MLKKIFILVGHPDPAGSLSSKIAETYEAGALAAGHEVRLMHAGAMRFDPILHRGYKVIQELEPDLQTFQQNVVWSDHFVVVYPNWWCTMPAILKGIFDRAWLPGFAFRFRKSGMGWEKLLKGRTARIIILANTNPWLTRVLFGEFTNELARATLAFAGIAPVRISVLNPSERASESCKTRWFQKMRQLGSRAK